MRALVTEGDQAWYDAATAAGVPMTGSPECVALFRKAFTHRSAAPRTSPAECNERLEFLGDAVISAAVSKYIFLRFPGESEGFLTDMRSKLVRGKALADLARATGLSSALIRHRQPGQGQGDGASSASESTAFDPAHEDLFEAVVGAVSLDSGHDSAASWTIAAVERHVDLSELVRDIVSSRAALQREMRSMGMSDLDVEVTSQPGGTFKAVARCDLAVAGVGEGRTGKQASESACAAARQYLGLA